MGKPEISHLLQRTLGHKFVYYLEGLIK